MAGWIRQQVGRRGTLLLVLGLLGGYWLLPISGQVVIVPERGSGGLPWPQIQVEPLPPRPGQKVTVNVTDVVPWGHVLLTVNGQPAHSEGWRQSGGGTWTWKWTYVPSETRSFSEGGDTILIFYRDCDSGCAERGLTTIVSSGQPSTLATKPTAKGVPTKLGVVFANPERNWHGRSGWVVDLTYAQLADAQSAGDAYWGIDQLAARVSGATAEGLRVLVRVDYDRGQSAPPADDHLALTEYLRYLRRLARDERLRGVYGYIIGSGFNALDSNKLAPDQPVTPAWYARLFDGYGEPISHTDNVVQTIGRENPKVRVLVGPVRPWIGDQDGEARHSIDAPWLNYMNTLVAALDEGAQAKAAGGVALTAPDGFAIQAAGRPAAAELRGGSGAEEPRMDLGRVEWQGAQEGFRVYRDWLDIINAYPTTRGLPVYITSTNTFAPDDGTPPAQNYPRGWLTTALQVIDAEPQVLALCWFMDGLAGDKQWDWFSLSRSSGRLIDAAEEFDALLQGAVGG